MPILAEDINDYFGILGEQYAQGARDFLTILVPRKSVRKQRLRRSQEKPSNRVSSAAIWRAIELGISGDAKHAPLFRNLTQYWNDQIQQGSDNFQHQHDGVKSIIIDPGPIYNQILDQPTANGAPNSTCWNSDGATCLWHDDFVHPGLAIQRAFGQQVGEVLQSSFGF